MADPTTDNATLMSLKILATHQAAKGIRSFELGREDGTGLPEFSAGSHIKIQVPNGEWRKYSLCNDPSERQRYVITVKREAQGRGGSVSMVDEAKEGDTVLVAPPDNAFPLVDNPGSLTFIAGGIGITPILSMIRSFGELPPAPWKLYYLSQAAETTAFLGELGSDRYRSNVKIHHDLGNPDACFDLWPILEKPNRGHVYCCGPRGLMEAVRDMSGHWSPKRIHFESFLEGGESGLKTSRSWWISPSRTKLLKCPWASRYCRYCRLRTCVSAIRAKAGRAGPVGRGCSKERQTIAIWCCFQKSKSPRSWFAFPEPRAKSWSSICSRTPNHEKRKIAYRRGRPGAGVFVDASHVPCGFPGRTRRRVRPARGGQGSVQPRFLPACLRGGGSAGR